LKASRAFRPNIGILVPVALLLSVPIVSDEVPLEQEPAKAPAPVLPFGPEIPAAANEPRAPVTPKVAVNKTVPTVKPVPLLPVFSEVPTDEEIFRARLFGEPFVPVGGTTSVEENQAFAKAVSAYVQLRETEGLGVLEAFLKDHPSSPWRASLLTNMGAFLRWKGYFTRAERALREAWELSKRSEEPYGHAVGDRALTELLDLHMVFGHLEALEPLVTEIGGRTVGGGATVKVYQARTAAWGLRHRHQDAVPSGPLALYSILQDREPGTPWDPKLSTIHATPEGASFTQLHALAQDVGLKMHLAFREKEARIPTPSVVHFKQKHFSAVLREQNGSYLLGDPILGGEVWMSREALKEEASGYFLIPDGAPTEGWRGVSDGEVEEIRGKCWIGGFPNPQRTRPCDIGKGGSSGGCKEGGCNKSQPKGMAQYSLQAVVAGLLRADQVSSLTSSIIKKRPSNPRFSTSRTSVLSGALAGSATSKTTLPTLTSL